MRLWHRNLRDIGWSLGATRNEGLGPNSICSAPNLRRAPTRPEAPTTLEARKRFSERKDVQGTLGTTARRHTILIIGISRVILCKCISCPMYLSTRGTPTRVDSGLDPLS